MHFAVVPYVSRFSNRDRKEGAPPNAVFVGWEWKNYHHPARAERRKRSAKSTSGRRSQAWSQPQEKSASATAPGLCPTNQTELNKEEKTAPEKDPRDLKLSADGRYYYEEDE
jgi:hypothetical protein